MTVPAVKVTWVDNADGTVFPSWQADADVNIDEYEVSYDGGPTFLVKTTSGPSLPGNVPHTVIVTPSSSDAETASAQYTPPVTLAPLLCGALDRSGIPPATYARNMAGGVINGKEQGEIGLDELFPTSNMVLAPNNGIETTILAAEALEKQLGLPVGAIGLVLRPAAGFHVPSYIMSADGAPVQVSDPTSGHSGPVSRGFWIAGSKLAQWFEEAHTILAGRFNGEPHIRVVEMGRNTTAYNEWCIKQISDAPSVAALRAAGYTTAADIAAHARDVAFLSTVWTYPRIGSAYNPMQVIGPTSVSVDPTITTAAIQAHVAALGKQASIENCSLSLTRPNDPTYAPLYETDMPAAHAAGASVRIQTATPSKVGNLLSVCQYAATVCKATSVEFPTGYSQPGSAVYLTPAEVLTITQALGANRNS